MSVKLKVNDTHEKHIYIYIYFTHYSYYYACRSDITFENMSHPSILKVCHAKTLKEILFLYSTNYVDTQFDNFSVCDNSYYHGTKRLECQNI